MSCNSFYWSSHMEHRKDKHAAVRELQTIAQPNNPEVRFSVNSSPEICSFSAQWRMALAGEDGQGLRGHQKYRLWHKFLQAVRSWFSGCPLVASHVYFPTHSIL